MKKNMEEADKLERKINSKSALTKTINYVWIIDDFSKIPIDAYKYSPWFPSSEKLNKWHGTLYLHGSGSVSVYLNLTDDLKKKNFTVGFSFNVLNSEYSTALSKRFDSLTDADNFADCCFSASKDKLQSHAENDKLKIEIIINLEFSFDSSYKVQFETDDPINVSANGFQSMLSSRNFSDFAIKVEDEEFAVHKVVLAARSPVFNAMLKNDVLEVKEGFVKISDFSKNTLWALIKFMYTLQIDIKSIEDAKQLFLAADKYDMSDLKRVCGNYLIKNCAVRNIFDSLVFAYNNNAVRLIEGLGDYVAVNKDLFKNLGSLKLSDPYQNLMKNFILRSLRE